MALARQAPPVYYNADWAIAPPGPRKRYLAVALDIEAPAPVSAMVCCDGYPVAINFILPASERQYTMIDLPRGLIGKQISISFRAKHKFALHGMHYYTSDLGEIWEEPKPRLNSDAIGSGVYLPFPVVPDVEARYSAE